MHGQCYSPSVCARCTAENYHTMQYILSIHKSPRPEEYPCLWLRQETRDVAAGRSRHRPHGHITAVPHANLAPLGHRSAGSRGQLWRPQTSACTTQGPPGADGPCHGTAGAQRSRVCTCTHTPTHAQQQQQAEAPRDVQRLPSPAAGCLLASRAHRPDRHRMRQIYQNPSLDSPLTGGALEGRRLRCAPFAACILLPRNQERERERERARVAILAPAACALHFAVTQLPPKERGTRPHALAPSPVVVVLRQQLPDLVSIRLAWSLVPHLTFHSLRASVLLLCSLLVTTPRSSRLAQPRHPQ